MFHLLEVCSAADAELCLLASQANCRGDKVYSQNLPISDFIFEGNAACQLGSALFFLLMILTRKTAHSCATSEAVF